MPCKSDRSPNASIFVVLDLAEDYEQHEIDYGDNIAILMR